MALPPTFTNRARLQAGRVPDRQGAPSAIGQAASIIGRTMGQIGQQTHEIDQRIADSEQRIREREIARDREVRDVELQEQMLNLQLDRAIKAREIEENYRVGDDVPAAVNKLYDDSDAAFLDGIGDEQLRGKYRTLLASERVRAMDRADIFTRQKRAEREQQATVGVGTALQNKMIVLGPEGSIKDFDEAEATIKSVITEEKFGTKAGTITTKMLAGLADSYLDGRLAAGDLKGAADAITSGRFAAFMDPGVAAAALAKIQQRAKSEAQAQVSDFKADARTAIKDVNAGVAVDPRMLSAMAAQAEAAGEGDLAHDLRNAEAVRKVNDVYANAPPADIVAARRKIEQSGKGWRSQPALVAAWNRLGTLEGENRARVKSDVLGLWSASGQAVASLDIRNPASIRARHKDAMAAQDWFGGPLQVMSADEVEPLKRQFEQGSASDRAAIIANFASVGGDTGKAFMRQIAPAKPEYAWLADLASMRNRTVGMGTMREALNGWEQIKANGAPVQGENGTKMGQAFARLIGNAIPVDQAPARQAVLQVARGLYAARALQSGETDYDAKLWESAVRDALGDAKDGTGGIGVTRGGAPMILPRGGSQRDVDQAMARASGPNIVAAAGGNMPMWGQTRLKVGQLLDMQMEWAGDGYYRFRNASGKYVSASNDPRQPFTLNIRRLATLNQQAPAAVPKPAADPKPALQGKGSKAANMALGGASLFEMLGISLPGKQAVRQGAADALGGRE